MKRSFRPPPGPEELILNIERAFELEASTETYREDPFEVFMLILHIGLVTEPYQLGQFGEALRGLVQISLHSLISFQFTFEDFATCVGCARRHAVPNPMLGKLRGLDKIHGRTYWAIFGTFSKEQRQCFAETFSYGMDLLLQADRFEEEERLDRISLTQWVNDLGS